MVSDGVRTEAQYAQESGKLVPVRIEPCSIPLAFTLSAPGRGGAQSRHPSLDALKVYLQAYEALPTGDTHIA